MDAGRDTVPDDIAALKGALAAERAKALEIAAELAVARAKASEDEALIAQQKLQIAKLKHQIYGQRSERSSRLIEQLALTFEELESDATEDELAAEHAVHPVLAQSPSPRRSRSRASNGILAVRRWCRACRPPQRLSDRAWSPSTYRPEPWSACDRPYRRTVSRMRSVPMSIAQKKMRQADLGANRE